MTIHRRAFLKNAGVVLVLPLFESLVPARVYAQSQNRNKFIGVFTPNGALMPQGANGNWTFAGALRPLVDAGHQANVSILRGVQGGSNADPHWLNTAGFLSSMPLTLGADRPTVCGTTLDQYVADHYRSQTTLHSMQMGWKPMNRDFSGDHAHFSDRYLDTLSWKANNRPVANVNSPQVLFNNVFSSSEAGAKRILQTNARKKSLLDYLLSDLASFKNKLGKSDQYFLEGYLEGIRGLERSLAAEVNKRSCERTISSPSEILPYTTHFEVMHDILAHALQCDVISSATLMYDDGVGDVYLSHPGAEGHDHHHFAHHGSNSQKMSQLNSINTAHARLFADLLTKLKAKGQLQRSVLLWGSNMSDGNLHVTANLPMLVAGQGAGMRLGAELGSAESPTLKSDVLLEIARGLGLNVPSFGAGPFLSTGKKIGIFT